MASAAAPDTKFRLFVTLPGRETSDSRGRAAQEEAVGVVVPIADPNKPVSIIMALIAQRLRKHVPPNRKDLRLMSMRLNGCAVNPNDICAEILRSGDHVEVVDSDLWIAKIGNYQKLTKWISIERTDLDSSKRITLDVGLHDSGAIYLKYWEANQAKRMDLFDAESLASYPADGVVSVMKKEREDGARVELKFKMVGGRAVSAEASVMVGTDGRPTIRAQAIKYEDDIISADGEVQVVQDDAPPKSTLALPESTRVGPSLDPALLVEPATREPAEDVFSVGDLGFKLKQQGPVFGDMSRNIQKDGTWYNRFYCTFRYIHDTEGLVNVSKIEAHYHNGTEWVKCCQVWLGYRRGFYNYDVDWRTEEPHFESVGPDISDNHTLVADIPFNEPRLDVERRAHPSLPNPLRIRFTLTSLNNHSSTIEVQHINPALSCKTLESFEKDKASDGPVKFFLYCDDLKFLERVYACGWLYKDGNSHALKIRVWDPQSSSYHQYSLTTLRKLAFKAVKANTDVLELTTDDINLPEPEKNCNIGVKAFLMVDLQLKTVYGFKFVFTTNTGSAEQYAPLPEELLESAE